MIVMKTKKTMQNFEICAEREIQLINISHKQHALALKKELLFLSVCISIIVIALCYTFALKMWLSIKEGA